LILVFPKLFEFYKFVCFLRHSDKFELLRLDAPAEGFLKKVWILECRRTTDPKSTILRFRVFLIDESDIRFNDIFSLMVQQHKDACYILIGSCGSPVASDLGKSFVVTEVVKGDRGAVDEFGHFTIRDEKCVLFRCLMVCFTISKAILIAKYGFLI
jgi:hypothetical protein